MNDRTHQLERVHGALRGRHYWPVTTFDQAVTPGDGRGGRVEHWTRFRGDGLVQVSLEDGVVSSVEVHAPLVLAETLEAL
jgi:hypothetical protein